MVAPKTKAERYLFQRHAEEFERALKEFADRGLDMGDSKERSEMASELRDVFWETKRWKKA